MVLSFAFAMVAIEAIGRYVTFYTMNTLVANTSSFLSALGIVAIYTAIMIAITWTVFGLLSQLSSQVFAWVDQAGHELGESKGESNFVAAVGSTKQAASSVGSSAMMGSKPSGEGEKSSEDGDGDANKDGAKKAVGNEKKE